MLRTVLLPFLLLTNLLSAQTAAEREVLVVIDRFFETMSARDSAGMAAIMTPDGIFHSVVEDGGGRPPKAFTHASYISGLKRGKERILERYWNAEVRLNGPLATVTTPYDFHVDGVLSHCGIDVFTLVKDADGWKISGGMFTMRNEDCIPSPLGPVK